MTKQEQTKNHLAGDNFWQQPADICWALLEHKGAGRNTMREYPWGVAEDGFEYGPMAAEDSGDYMADTSEETLQKVAELKRQIETLQNRLDRLNSPLKFVAEAIRRKARFESPAAAYQLLEQQDHIFRDCEQWRENVEELEQFLLREKQRAMLPPPPSANYPTDQQMAAAISSINGKGRVLDEYQKWLGVCCFACARCGYPMDLDACCKRLAALPYREPLEFVPQYKSIRVYATYNFVKAGYGDWEHFKVNDQERNLFIKCRDTALALEIALNKVCAK
ncbi:MAG: hypothetical protein IJ544_09280 [Prevotella sp.]|nr:hypothetical protein [Prevotella sp.]